MKKRWVLLASLLMGLLVLGACGSKKEADASANHDLLKPGTTWKWSDLDKWEKIKVIDETTWEYSEDMNPDPVQVTVKREKDYEGFETYEITDSGGVRKFTSSSKKEYAVVPLNEKNIQKMALVGVNTKDKDSHDDIVEYARKNVSEYKLQKTGE